MFFGFEPGKSVVIPSCSISIGPSHFRKFFKLNRVELCGLNEIFEDRDNEGKDSNRVQP